MCCIKTPVTLRTSKPYCSNHPQLTKPNHSTVSLCKHISHKNNCQWCLQISPSFSTQRRAVFLQNQPYEEQQNNVLSFHSFELSCLIKKCRQLLRSLSGTVPEHPLFCNKYCSVDTIISKSCVNHF